MTLIAVLVILMQLGFGIHCIRTGRPIFWLFVIVFLPVIGCLLYFATQIVPEIAGSRSVTRAKGQLVNTIDPQRELRRRRELLEASGTVENRAALADECVEAKMYDEAIALYKECLVGVHKTDPSIMEKLAQAYFEKSAAAEAKATLDDLIRENPDHKSVDGHLLYARTLEALGQLEEAGKEYEILSSSYPGEEARVRYALLLKQTGKADRAQELFRETLARTKRAPKYYQAKEREWTRIAESQATG